MSTTLELKDAPHVLCSFYDSTDTGYWTERDKNLFLSPILESVGHKIIKRKNGMPR